MWKHWHFWHSIWLSAWTFFLPCIRWPLVIFFLGVLLKKFVQLYWAIWFYKTLNHVFPFHVLGCMYVWIHVYMCVMYVCVCSYVCTYTWKHKVDLGISLDSFFTLYIEPGPLTRTQICLRDPHLHHLRPLGGSWGRCLNTLILLFAQQMPRSLNAYRFYRVSSLPRIL